MASRGHERGQAAKDRREVDEFYPDSERAACAFHMARAAAAARESFSASKEPSWPFREIDRPGGHAKGENVVVFAGHIF